MSGALWLVFLSTLGGAALTLPLWRRASLTERVALGIPLGMAIQGLIGLVIALRIGFSGVTLALAATLGAAPLLVLLRRDARGRLRRGGRVARLRLLRTFRKPTLGALGLALWYGLFGAVLVRFFAGTCYINPEGGFSTNNWANAGDLPYHIGIVHGFTIGQNYPPDHPEMEGARLTYPFLCDFVAALYVGAGTAVSQAFYVQNIALMGSLVFWIWRLTAVATGSTRAAHLAVPITLLSGGWGFLRLWEDLGGTNGNVIELLKHLPHDYTREMDSKYRLSWGTMLFVLLGTQRSILFGMPLALGIWRLWLARHNRGVMLLAGLCAGTLPLGHIHTFLMLGMVGGVFGLVSLFTGRWKPWVVFFSTMLGVGALALRFMLAGSSTQAGNFVKVQPGWDSHAESLPQWVSFWLFNTGITFPLLILALGLVATRRQLLLWLPCMLAFVVPNVLKLAPWEWDNIKVLIYAHLATAPLIALLLARLWELRRLTRALVPVALVGLTLAGGLDVWRVTLGTATQEVFSHDDVVFAKALETAAPPRARILTAPSYNHPVYLAGRRSWLGYTAHLFSHGLIYDERETAMQAIYTGAPEAAAMLDKYKIEYVVIGPKELREIPQNLQASRGQAKSVDEAFFAKYPVVVEAGGYKLFKIR